MYGVLLKLKGLLNSIPNEELKNYSLWIDANDEIETILIEEETISLIRNRADVRIDSDK